MKPRLKKNIMKTSKLDKDIKILLILLLWGFDMLFIVACNLFVESSIIKYLCFASFIFIGCLLTRLILNDFD